MEDRGLGGGNVISGLAQKLLRSATGKLISHSFYLAFDQPKADNLYLKGSYRKGKNYVVDKPEVRRSCFVELFVYVVGLCGDSRLCPVEAAEDGKAEGGREEE